MNEQAGIALDLGDVFVIVMNSMAVKGAGGISKQHDGIGRDFAGIFEIVRSHGGLAAIAGTIFRVRWWVVAVDEIMFFLNGETGFAAEPVRDGADYQGAGASTLDLNRFDLGLLAHHFAQDQRFVVGRAKPAEHTARQGNRGHESATIGMAVGADSRLPHTWLEITPVAHGPDRFAFARDIGFVEQGSEALNAADAGAFLNGFRLADPVFQPFQVVRHGVIYSPADDVLGDFTLQRRVHRIELIESSRFSVFSPYATPRESAMIAIPPELVFERPDRK